MQFVKVLLLRTVMFSGGLLQIFKVADINMN